MRVWSPALASETLFESHRNELYLNVRESYWGDGSWHSQQEFLYQQQSVYELLSFRYSLTLSVINQDSKSLKKKIQLIKTGTPTHILAFPGDGREAICPP